MGIRSLLHSLLTRRQQRRNHPARRPTRRSALAVRQLEDRLLRSGGVYPYTPGCYASWGVGQSFAGAALDPGTAGIDLHVVWNAVQTGPLSVCP